MTCPVRARISIPALQHNLQRVREAAPGARVMAVIKANGYGHGLQQVATALAAADGFAVARLEEGLALRAAGVAAPITLLEGVLDSAGFDAARHHGLVVVIHSEAQLVMLEGLGRGPSLEAWVKIDTGMHRLGFPPALVGSVVKRLQALGHGVCLTGFMSHLACADDRARSETGQQHLLFEQTLTGMEGQRSLANSAGILGWPQSHYDWVRPGIMLYGVSPFADGCGSDLDLRPVMTLASQLIAVNRLSKGDAVGYGGTWVCPEDMPVGVVAVGYGDGYPRHARAGTPVLVNGQRVPLVGRVSMDMVTVDLRALPDAEVGDPVVLWGDGLPVEEIAAAAGTIAYELLTGVTGRVQFEY